MMVETILESSQDFGMSNGSLPQWKRELLQRRAARSRPAAAAAAPAPPPPPPPPPADDDEELRYGPGIVKRLKSRYLSLALRDAPRRRPSVLRRAASLEHLLDERPPPAPRAPRPPRPASLAAPAPLAALAAPARRDSVKRARSVDALSRLEARDEPAPPSPSPPPPAPRPGGGRAARPPRRPAPLLRDAERPPPDVVRSALRKFESAPTRRAAPAARVSAVLRGLEGARRSVTPDRGDDERSPSPPPDAPPPPTEPPPPPPAESPPPASPPPAPAPSPPIAAVPATSSFQAAVAPTVAKIVEAEVATTPTPAPAPAPRSVPPATPAGGDEPAGGAVRAVSRAALEGIARAGSSVRYAFEAARGGSHLPPLAAANPVLVARRVGVIRPMPAPPRRAPSPPRKPSPPAPAQAREERLDAVSPERALVNGHSTPEPRAVSRIGAAGIERAWSGSAPAAAAAVPWARAGAGRARAPPASTSVVFNFSDRKEVPDYIENDGIILRAARRNRIKAAASEPGVVVLRPAAGEDSADEADETDDGPPSPCAVRFVNDNVLINGRSSMPPRPLRDPNRSAKLKLQFDESLTRTFEYPSETSLCEDSPSDGSASPALPATSPAPAATSPAPAATSPAPEQDHNHDQPPQLLVDNTHIASAVLSRYTPSKTAAGAFQLGVAAPAPAPAPAPRAEEAAPGAGASAGACGDACACACGRGCGAGADACGAERHAVPCGADAARAWSDARCAATDLLF